jgi:hypothetical protein
MGTENEIKRGSKTNRPGIRRESLGNQTEMIRKLLLSKILTELLQRSVSQQFAVFAMAAKVLSRISLKVGCSRGGGIRQIMAARAITSIDSARSDDLEYRSTCFDYRQSLHVVLAVPPHFAGM